MHVKFTKCAFDVSRTVTKTSCCSVNAEGAFGRFYVYSLNVHPFYRSSIPIYWIVPFFSVHAQTHILLYTHTQTHTDIINQSCGAYTFVLGELKLEFWATVSEAVISFHNRIARTDK